MDNSKDYALIETLNSQVNVISIGTIQECKIKGMKILENNFTLEEIEYFDKFNCVLHCSDVKHGLFIKHKSRIPANILA